ncbi:MAG: ABC transporter permease subunit [Eubacteriales bacterium]|nr:ABC transporter permease subunit [Eubacteriales bacterium]
MTKDQNMKCQVKKTNSRRFSGKSIWNNWELYLFMLPALLYILLYCYYPMYGVQIAFKNFRASAGIQGSEWVGMEHFVKFLGNPVSWELIRNTLSISILALVIGFPAPIIFALIVNELKSKRFQKMVQTISYAPHFISTVVLVSMLTSLLDPSTGIINKILGIVGGGPYDFMSRADWFAGIYVISDIWQHVGWNAVIYLAALAGIDYELHEAAMMDGASRLKRIWHINLPGILPTIAILLILQTGNLMSVGFEKVFLMQNPLNLETSEIISTFVYKMGLQYRQYSYSTAIGLFNSIINLVLLVSVNFFAKKASGHGLW